jgi:hypothetical protein
MNNTSVLLNSHFFEYLTPEEIFKSLPLNLLHKLKKYYFPTYKKINEEHLLNIEVSKLGYTTVHHLDMTRETFGFRTLLYPDFIRYMSGMIICYDFKFTDILKHENIASDLIKTFSDKNSINHHTFNIIFKNKTVLDAVFLPILTPETRQYYYEWRRLFLRGIPSREEIFCRITKSDLKKSFSMYCKLRPITANIMLVDNCGHVEDMKGVLYPITQSYDLKNILPASDVGGLINYMKPFIHLNITSIQDTEVETIDKFCENISKQEFESFVVPLKVYPVYSPAQLIGGMAHLRYSN